LQYTFILPASKNLPKVVVDPVRGTSKHRGTVGVRWPSNALCQVSTQRHHHQQQQKQQKHQKQKTKTKTKTTACADVITTELNRTELPGQLGLTLPHFL
jgi:hypothetical protein